MAFKNGDVISEDNFLSSYIAGEAITDGDAVAYYYSDKKVYKASAAAFNFRLNFIGFAVGGVAAGARCKVNFQPIVFKTVTIDTTYFLSDTQGAIGTSAGTLSREIGIGIQSTRLKRPMNGVAVSTLIYPGTSFTSPVTGFMMYGQNGALITINGTAYGFDTTFSALKEVYAFVKPGDVVVISNAGGASTYGPYITLLDA